MPATDQLAPLNPYDYCKVVKSRAGKTFPDLYNSPATKLLSRADAQQLSWPYYFDAAPCRCGHVSARMSSNTQCCDCHRIKKGLPTIYATAKNQTFYKPPAPKAVAANAGAPVAAAVAPLEPDGPDKRILKAIGDHGSLAEAAKALGSSVGAIEARRAVNPTFAAALQALESRLDIKRVLPPAADIKWSAEIESRLIRTWIDTGNIAAARDACGVSPSQYFAHIEDSHDFAAAVDKAAPLAAMALREKVQQIALAGNPQLLAKFVPDKPEERPKAQTREELIDEIVRTIFLAKSRNANPPTDSLSEPAAVAVSDDPDYDDLI